MTLNQMLFFFFQAEDGIRDHCVTGVQTCALPISEHFPIEAERLADFFPAAQFEKMHFMAQWSVDRESACHCANHPGRSEEHTSELQSHSDLVCRLLLEKQKRARTLPVHGGAVVSDD